MITAPYAPLGKTALRIARICLGTMTFGNPVDASKSARLVAHALERGVNFFDTSNAYEGYSRSFHSAGGIAEELLGRALARRRHEAVICTKFGNPIGSGPLDAGLSARHLETELEKSLRRLQTDYIDLVLAHRWDADASIDHLWTVFDRWVRSGKVLTVGTSNWPVWRMAQACEKNRYSGRPFLAVSSPRYNLLNREIELEHVPCAAEYGIALVTYQPFQGGLLTGRYRRDAQPPPNSRGAAMPSWMPPLDDQLFDRVQALESLARDADLTLLEYVTAWMLARPFVASIVVGSRSPDQLDQVLRGAIAKLPAEHAGRVDALFPPAAPRNGEAVLAWQEHWRLLDQEPC